MKELLEKIKEFLIPIWIEENERNGFFTQSFYAPSYNMCRYSSVFLINLLSEKFPDENWQIQGGEPEYEYFWMDNVDPSDPGPPDIKCLKKGGYIKYSESEGSGHLWIKNATNIIDITADQFGGEKIIITSLDDPRYIMNMTEEKLKKAMVLNRNIIDEWIDTWHNKKSYSFR